jgi:hypothetical protein
LCSETDDDPTSTIGILQRFVDLEIAAVSVEAAGGKVNIVYSRTVGACSLSLSTRMLCGGRTPNVKVFCSGPQRCQKAP